MIDTSDILDSKIKQELVNKSDISNLVKKCDLNIKLATLVTKSELKVEQDKMKLQAFDSSYLNGKYLFGAGSFWNIFIYQPTLNILT